MLNTNQLNEQQLKDLEQLSHLCKTVDGSVPNLYTHILEQLRSLPASLLYYEHDVLVAFLGVYFFYDDAVEVSVLVHPEHRKKGIAKLLLRAILPLIQSQNFNRLIFSTPAQRNNTWLPTKGLTYKHSEYYMVREDLKPLLDCTQKLDFHTASIEDIPKLHTLAAQCFPGKNGDSNERLQHIIDGREYQIILAYQDNQLVGKAHLRWTENGATLSDIAVFPELQGKGIGTALITYCVNLALSEGKPHLDLDVETHNTRALQLYSRLGFLSQNACDYWELNLHAIHK